DEPVHACPPSAWYRFRKFARRNRAALLTASGVILAVALTAAVSTGLIWRANQNLQEALKREHPGSLQHPLYLGPQPPSRGQPGPRPQIPRGVPRGPAWLGVALPDAALPGRAGGHPGENGSLRRGV